MDAVKYRIRPEADARCVVLILPLDEEHVPNKMRSHQLEMHQQPVKADIAST
jgi:hypothetical protein